MQDKFLFIGKFIDGALRVSAPTTWKKMISFFGDKEFQIIISSKKVKRTIAQNSFFYLNNRIVERETGIPAEEVHKTTAVAILGVKEIKMFGLKIQIPKSTSNLSKQEFCEFMDAYYELFQKKAGIELADYQEWKRLNGVPD